MRIGRGFLSVARRLIKNANSEADFRSVINRSYYASFRVCREIAAPRGYKIDRSGTAHRTLIEFLQGPDNGTVRQCDDLLENLRRLWQISDYSLEGLVERSDVLNSVEDAADIVEEKLIELMPDAE
jgi:hypothetical protein